MLNPHIFREYDIRGVVGSDLTSETVEILGKGIGTTMRRKGLVRISVGRDIRLSSPEFSEQLIKGIRSTGLDVIDIGVAPTPLVYFSLFTLNIDGGVMITGSHNPPEFNGFKICVGKTTIHGQDIKDIQKIIETGTFARGEGRLFAEQDLTRNYIDTVKTKTSISKKIKVVIDGGNGVGGMIAPSLLREVGCDVVEMYCEPDGNFPNHFPDPTVEKNLIDLAEKVRETNADVGIGYDGDADRIGVVDNTGKVVWGDQLMVLFSRDILKRKPGSKIVFEVKCSQNLSDDIEKNGGIPIMNATGHSLIKERMIKEEAELAGEMSGHIFFSDGYFGFDDAIFASCRLLQILSETDQKLSELLSDLPVTYATPEIRVDCPDSEKFEIVQSIAEEFKLFYNVIDIDGVRVKFEDGWGLLRASNTQPIIVLRFESTTQEGLQRIKGIFHNKLKNLSSLRGLESF